MSEDKFLATATDRITLLLTTYCGYRDEKNTSMLVPECLALLIRRFGHLGLNEIDEAFRLNASGAIKGNAIAYGGVATVIGFGDVITHYNEYRRKAVALIEAEERANSKEVQDALEDERKRNEYVAMVTSWFHKQVFKFELKSFRDVPHYYCDTLEDLGLLSFEKFEKQAYMKQALLFIQKQKEEKGLTDRQAKDDYVRLKSIIENGFTGLYERKDLRAECIMAAKSIAVFEKLKLMHDAM